MCVLGQVVLLFDIDGTLLSTKAGRTALEMAIADSTGIARPDCNVDFAGRTDRSIVRELFLRNSITWSESQFGLVRDRYLELFPDLMRQQGAVLLPGVRKLLESLQHIHGVTLNAMTGNFCESGWQKLKHFKLDLYFEHVFGGGEDLHRDDLAKRARDSILDPCGDDLNSESFGGQWTGNVEVTGCGTKGHGDGVERHESKKTVSDSTQFVVVGDTVADIRCAKAINARSIAVLTGGVDADELYAAKPDRIFVDLSDTQSVVKELLGSLG